MSSASAGCRSEQRQRPLGGNPFAGATAVFRSPYLLGIAFFVLLATVTTFLYFEQAKLVAERFTSKEEQTQVFGLIDTVVQTLAILTQVFLTGRIAQKLGVGVLLVAVPLVVAAGFLWLALAPVFAVFVVVMVARRAGEYALVRPGREMLYTVMLAEQKYKAKSFIDTFVYRSGDLLGIWLTPLLGGLSIPLGGPAAALSAAWLGGAGLLGRRVRRGEAATARPR